MHARPPHGTGCAVVVARATRGRNVRAALIISGSISIVSTRSMLGEPSSTCVVSPDPCPMFATVRACGAYISGSAASNAIVYSSALGRSSRSPRARRILIAASGLPLVARVALPLFCWTTLTVAVRPSA